MLTDSGGPGEFRGGLGQQIEFVNDSGGELVISCLAGRTEFAPQGLHQGAAGSLRQVRINGEPVHPKGRYVLAPGDRLTTLEAGGGGIGDPKQRDRSALARDVALGYVSPASAERDYGWTPTR
jgi:N-methylhydantoinase B